MTTEPLTTGVAPDVERVQRRTVGVLSGAVALGGLGITVGITVGGLLARDVAGTDAAAGLGQTAGVLGAAVLAVPLARITDRAGRRAGLVTGYGIAVLGALLSWGMGTAGVPEGDAAASAAERASLAGALRPVFISAVLVMALGTWAVARIPEVALRKSVHDREPEEQPAA